MNHRRIIEGALAAVLLAGGFGRALAAEAEPVGSETCLGCHAERDVKKKLHTKAMSTAKGVPFDKACETCHGPGSLHAAAAGDKSSPGFATIKNPKDQSAAEQSETCLTCHKQKNLTLWGTSSHKQGGLSCAKCHTMHGDQKKNLAKDGVETCLTCHKKQRGELQLASHHPLIEGRMTCAGCHNPHGGVSGNLRGETVEDTCFKCHADKAGPFMHEHPPVVEECTTCHKPHGSANATLLKQGEPMLCLRCHKWPHTESTNNVSAMKTKTFEQRSRCTDCHNQIHGSDRKAGLKD